MSSEVQYRADKCPPLVCAPSHIISGPTTHASNVFKVNPQLAPTISSMLRFPRVFLWNMWLVLKIDHSHCCGCPYNVHFHAHVSLCYILTVLQKLCVWLYVRST